MKKITAFVCAMLLFGALFIPSASAQRSEFGAMGGCTFYLGDLNQARLFKEVHPAGGFMFRYNISPRWAVKADFLFGKLSGSDVGTDHANRNLSFSSPLTEFSAEAELNFLKLYNQTGKNRFSPYIFAGITLFSFNPKAELNGVSYDLQSLGTEGQALEGGADKRYSLTSVAIPFGIGVKFTMGRHFSIGAEWGFRYTFSDYIDDVSNVYFDNEILRAQRGDVVGDLADRTPELINTTTGEAMPVNVAGTQRGNVTNKDLYSFAGIFFTVKFGNEDKTCDVKLPKKRRY